jgi:hypothetical protein
MPALTEIFGDDACLQFGGGTLDLYNLYFIFIQNL